MGYLNEGTEANKGWAEYDRSKHEDIFNDTGVCTHIKYLDVPDPNDTSGKTKIPEVIIDMNKLQEYIHMVQETLIICYPILKKYLSNDQGGGFNAIVTDEVNTASTDGRYIFFNPLFLWYLAHMDCVNAGGETVGWDDPDEATIFVYLHEIYHCMFLHHLREEKFGNARKGGVDHNRANIVQDQEINSQLEGFSSFNEVFRDGKQIGMCKALGVVLFSKDAEEGTWNQVPEEMDKLLYNPPFEYEAEGLKITCKYPTAFSCQWEEMYEWFDEHGWPDGWNKTLQDQFRDIQDQLDNDNQEEITGNQDEYDEGYYDGYKHRPVQKGKAKDYNAGYADGVKWKQYDVQNNTCINDPDYIAGKEWAESHGGELQETVIIDINQFSSREEINEAIKASKDLGLFEEFKVVDRNSEAWKKAIEDWKKAQREKGNSSGQQGQQGQQSKSEDNINKRGNQQEQQSQQNQNQKRGGEDQQNKGSDKNKQSNKGNTQQGNNVNQRGQEQQGQEQGQQGQNSGQQDSQENGQSGEQQGQQGNQGQQGQEQNGQNQPGNSGNQQGKQDQSGQGNQPGNQGQQQGQNSAGQSGQSGQSGQQGGGKSNGPIKRHQGNQVSGGGQGQGNPTMSGDNMNPGKGQGGQGQGQPGQGQGQGQPGQYVINRKVDPNMFKWGEQRDQISTTEGDEILRRTGRDPIDKGGNPDAKWKNKVIKNKYEGLPGTKGDPMGGDLHGGQISNPQHGCGKGAGVYATMDRVFQAMKSTVNWQDMLMEYIKGAFKFNSMKINKRSLSRDKNIVRRIERDFGGDSIGHVAFAIDNSGSMWGKGEAAFDKFFIEIAKIKEKIGRPIKAIVTWQFTCGTDRFFAEYWPDAEVNPRRLNVEENGGTDFSHIMKVMKVGNVFDKKTNRRIWQGIEDYADFPVVTVIMTDGEDEVPKRSTVWDTNEHCLIWFVINTDQGILADFRNRLKKAGYDAKYYIGITTDQI